MSIDERSLSEFDLTRERLGIMPSPTHQIESGKLVRERNSSRDEFKDLSHSTLSNNDHHSPGNHIPAKYRRHDPEFRENKPYLENDKHWRHEGYKEPRNYDREAREGGSSGDNYGTNVRREHRERERHDRDRRHRDRDHYESHRRHSRSPSPSPVIDFTTRKRWTGWDQPISRFFQPMSIGSSPNPNQYTGNAMPFSSTNSGPSNFNNYMLYNRSVNISNQGPGSNQNLQNSRQGLLSIPNALGINTTDHQQSQQAKQQRRLYLGNLPPTIVDSELIQFLNQAIFELPNVSKEPNMSSVIGMDMAADRNYAFLELRTPDEATYMTALDGISYKGHSLRIRRPREWKPTGKEPALPSIPVSTLGIVSTTVIDSPNKIFIGGLPPHFAESDVKELLTFVGPLKAFNLVRDSAGNSKFAFCEYAHPELTDVACMTLNGQAIGERKLVVQRSAPTKEKEGNSYLALSNCTIPSDGHYGNDPIVNGMGQDGSLIDGANTMSMIGDDQNDLPLLQSILTTSISTTTIVTAIATKAMQTPDILKQTNILVLLNAVDIMDEWTDDLYAALMEDMMIECSRHGYIRQLVIPRPPPKPKKKVFLMPGQLSESDIGGHKTKGEIGSSEGSHLSINPSNRMMNEGMTSSANLISNIENANDHPSYILPPGYGRIFIEYDSVEEAMRAQAALSGRCYDGRSIITSFVSAIPSSRIEQDRSEREKHPESHGLDRSFHHGHIVCDGLGNNLDHHVQNGVNNTMDDNNSDYNHALVTV